MATNCLKVKCLLVLVCVSLTTSEENVQEWTDSVVTEWAEVTRQRHDRHVSIDNDHVVESNKDSHHVDEVIEHVENRRFYDGRDKTTHYEDDEDALSSNAHDAEINGDSYHIDELIESVENRTVYDARNKTTHYEGVDYTTRFPHFEWAGVYERQSDPVLGPDHKEERETLTDQLEDNNGGEINPRGNKANITDEPEDQTPPGRKMTGRENQTIFTQEVFINTHVSVSIEATPETDLDGEREISDIETNLMKTYINNTNEDSKNITSDDLRVVIEDANETNAIRLNERFRGRITATKVSSSVASYQHLDASLEVPEYLQTSSVKNDYTETTRFTTSNDNTIPVTTVPYEISSEDIDFENKTPMYKIDEEPHINTRFEAKQEENSTEAMHQSKDVKQSRKWETLPVAKRIYAFNIDRSDVEHNFDNTLKTSAESSKEDLYPLPIQNNDKIISKDSLKSPVDNNYANVNHLGASVLFEPCTDCDLRILPIRPSQQRSTPDIEEESLPTPQINFADPPEGRELKIYSLGLTDGIYFFSYLSEFLSWIQPNDFPVELLRDSLKHQTTWISLILESVQVEAGFVVCLAAVVLLALAVPLVVLSHACYRMGAGDERDDDHSAAGGWAGNCKRRSLVAILQLLLILLFIGMAAMFVTNEQLSGAVVRSPEVLQTSLSDVSAFVHNAHLHIHFLVIQSLDQTLQAVFADLDNVDSLLGLPIQRELVKETGLDVGLETLSDLTREAKSTTESVERLLDEARTAQEMVASARDKLSDLRQQVELFRRACGPRDRTLCDSIDTSGLDVTFRLDRIKLDERLNRMRRMGGVGLEVATREARERFTAVPARVEIDTRDAREGVRRQLIRQREEVDDRSRALEEFTRDITAKVNEAKYQAGFWMQHLDEIEYWRWIVCLGGGAAVLMIWTMLLCSLCCGCCGSEKAAGPTILVALVLMCLFSSVLWTVVLVGLLVGGHGEVFLCRPLFDEPDFPAISRLVDEPGVFYDDHHGGFIANVIYGNDSLDIPIKQVLQDCQANRPVYPTLGLRRVFDVEAAVDDHRWVAVDSHLRAVRANLSSLEVLSPALQDQLADLLATLSVNFTEHRIQMSRPVTSKDMDSFAKQLDNIGNQMRDLATASRMETLSSRTRRLIESHIRPLEGKKDSLVYQLTALEVQTGPLQRQVNQSFSHLKTIQFFINSQGESIAQRKSREYASRLQSYVAQLRAHVTEAVGASVAPCRPLWDIFHSARLFFCRHTMDPLNGYWFATTCSLLVLLIATPVCLKLVDYYRLKGCRSSGSPENLVASEQNAAWSSPGYDIKYSKGHNGEYDK